MKRRLNIAMLGLWALVPTTVLAALGDGKIEERAATGSIQDLLNTVQTWLLSLVGGLTILFLIIGGVQYITSAGNTARAEAAKKTITYAIIGLIIVILTGLILELLTGGIMTSIFGDKSL